MNAYRCRHSGLYYPESWVKNWGSHKDHEAMGTRPVSLVWDTVYHLAPDLNSRVPMHPVKPCLAELDFVVITEEEFQSKRALTSEDDPDGIKRRDMVIQLQKKKSNVMQFLDMKK